MLGPFRKGKALLGCTRTRIAYATATAIFLVLTRRSEAPSRLVGSRSPDGRRAPPPPVDNGGRDDYEVATTNYGWDSPSGRDYPRNVWSGEMHRAVRSHPRYNASAWADLDANPDPTRRVVAFLDVMTCVEGNYPIYGLHSGGLAANMEAGRPLRVTGVDDVLRAACPHVRRALESPALTAHPDSRLVLPDCMGKKQNTLRVVCGRAGHDTAFRSPHLIVAYLSAARLWARPHFDVGLSPPAIRPANLSSSERDAARSCAERKYLFSFQGINSNAVRERLRRYEGDPDFYVRVYGGQDTYKDDIGRDGGAGKDANNYRGTMVDSVFSGAPMGDMLFSYRFSEILSAGTIPVVYADEWLPPFKSQVVNWTECAVFVKEADAGRTAEVLRAIPEGRRCEMRRRALETWDRYVADAAGRVRALIESALWTSIDGLAPGEVCAAFGAKC